MKQDDEVCELDLKNCSWNERHINTGIVQSVVTGLAEAVDGPQRGCTGSVKRRDQSMKSSKNPDHKIAKNGSVPIYRQLEDILKQRIKNGALKPGDQISTEFELCEEFGISRISVRQALAELANGGFLCRHQGRGTFVNHLVSSKVELLRALIAEEQWIPPLQEAVRSYNEEQHDSEIRLEIQAVGRPQLRSKILSAVGRGDAPDFALIDWAWGVEFANLHFLKRLDRLDPQWAEEFKADLFPAFVNKTTPALYGIQPEANVSVLWYR